MVVKTLDTMSDRLTDVTGSGVESRFVWLETCGRGAERKSFRECNTIISKLFHSVSAWNGPQNKLWKSFFLYFLVYMSKYGGDMRILW